MIGHDEEKRIRQDRRFGRFSLLLAAGLLAGAAFAHSAEYYISPGGHPSGDGSLGNPWDLQTAFQGGGGHIQAGDTLYLRGGIYSGSFSSNLTGTASSPIIVKSYTGEWARIDLPAGTGIDTFAINGQWTIYRDFELFCSDPSQVRDRTYLATNTPNNKFVNLFIHDVGNNSFGRGNEIYGSILTNNGTDGSGLAHHLYTQNEDASIPARIVDNIIVNGFAFGIHAYATNGYLRNIQMIGNVLFENGVAQTTGDNKDNIIVGSVNTQPDQILLQENYTWAPRPFDRNVTLGRYQDNNLSIALHDNYFAGGVTFYNQWASVEMTGNTFYSLQPGNGTNVDPANYPSNTYLTVAPTVNKVVIRPNLYETGRAHLIVYNWELKDTETIDVGSVLQVGNSYVIRNGQNYNGPPVAQGVYQGGLITLPLTGLSPSQPLGPGLIAPDEMTGKAFNVFVLSKAGGSSPPTVQPPSKPPRVGVKTKNVFNPTKGDTLLVGAYLDGQNGPIRIVDRQGHIVRTFDQTDASTTWNGRNEKGEMVASGVYIVISPTGRRKVVVVK